MKQHLNASKIYHVMNMFQWSAQNWHVLHVSKTYIINVFTLRFVTLWHFPQFYKMNCWFSYWYLKMYKISVTFCFCHFFTLHHFKVLVYMQFHNASLTHTAKTELIKLFICHVAFLHIITWFPHHLPSNSHRDQKRTAQNSTNILEYNRIE